MKRSLVAPVVLMLALLLGSSAFAQTGPTGPAGPNNFPVAPALSQNQGQMLPDRLADVLRKMGHQVDIRRFNDGRIIVVANIQQDGWRYEVDFEYTIDQRTINVVCPLGVTASRLSPARLIDILKKSYELNPVHFSVRTTDQMVLLEDPIYSTMNMNETGVANILNNMLKQVRATYPVWGGN